MAQSDWSFCTSSLAASECARGVTAGITPPSGGGSFVYGFNTLEVVSGAVALMCTQTNFAPTPANKGGRISAVMKRGLSGGSSGFAPFLFIGLQGTSTSDAGYLLGLSDNDASKIVLRKGTLVGGIPAAETGSSGVLAQGEDTIDPDECRRDARDAHDTPWASPAG